MLMDTQNIPIIVYLTLYLKLRLFVIILKFQYSLNLVTTFALLEWLAVSAMKLSKKTVKSNYPC